MEPATPPPPQKPHAQTAPEITATLAAAAAELWPSGLPMLAVPTGAPTNTPPTSPGRVLPDPDVCLARNSGFGDDAGYVDCLVDNPGNCPHSLGFGHGFFCRHPQRDEIMMRTDRTRPGSGPSQGAAQPI